MRIIEALAYEDCPATLEEDWEFPCGLRISDKIGDMGTVNKGHSEALLKAHQYHHSHATEPMSWQIIEEIDTLSDGTPIGKLGCDCAGNHPAQVYERIF